MRNQAFLAGFGQVVRQQQNAVGAQALGFLGVGNGRARGAASAGNDRHLAAAGVDRGLDDLAVLIARQREVFARAAGGEQRAGAKGREPFQARGIALGVEIALGREVRHREGQQAGAHHFFEILGIHGGHSKLSKIQKGSKEASAVVISPVADWRIEQPCASAGVRH